VDERTLFVGDVHGCADELAALLAAAQASRVILLGDLFRKGPDPAGVFALIEEHGCEVILGNHDLNLMNEDRQDAITPIVQALDRKTIYLLKNSGPFMIGDLERDDLDSAWCTLCTAAERYLSRRLGRPDGFGRRARGAQTQERTAFRPSRTAGREGDCGSRASQAALLRLRQLENLLMLWPE
jgi:hypothetical protein